MVQTPEDLLPSIYMILNRLAPAWEGTELGIGDHLLMKESVDTSVFSYRNRLLKKYFLECFIVHKALGALYFCLYIVFMRLRNIIFLPQSRTNI